MTLSPGAARPSHPAVNPDLHFRISDSTIVVTAKTPTARSLLELHGFARGADGSSYHPRGRLDERGLLDAVTAAEAHAYTHGLSARVDLGLPTHAAIPPAGQRPFATAPATPPPHSLTTFHHAVTPARRRLSAVLTTTTYDRTSLVGAGA